MSQQKSERVSKDSSILLSHFKNTYYLRVWGLIPTKIKIIVVIVLVFVKDCLHNILFIKYYGNVVRLKYNICFIRKFNIFFNIKNKKL